MIFSLLRRSAWRVASTAMVGMVLSTIWAAMPAAAGRHGGMPPLIAQALSAISSSKTYEVPAAGRMEVAFSPNAGAESLVIKVIDSAQRGGSVKLMAYNFTSAPVAQALVRAQHRGAKVQAVVDFKSNVTEDKFGKARAAMSSLVNAGAEVRTIDVYAIAHDKVIVVDGKTVELGSFNYSASAQSRNSENVLVNWDNPKLASVYTEHFERNWNQGRPFATRY